MLLFLITLYWYISLPIPKVSFSLRDEEGLEMSLGKINLGRATNGVFHNEVNLIAATANIEIANSRIKTSKWYSINVYTYSSSIVDFGN